MNEEAAEEINQGAIRRSMDLLHMMASLEPGAGEALAEMDEVDEVLLNLGIRMGIAGLTLELADRGMLKDA